MLDLIIKGKGMAFLWARGKYTSLSSDYPLIKEYSIALDKQINRKKVFVCTFLSAPESGIYYEQFDSYGILNTKTLQLNLINIHWKP